MTKSWKLLSTVALFAAIGSITTPVRVLAQPLPETVEAINKARITTRILFVTAHPDDEWSSLLTYLSRGLNADVALLTITRGQGGQNAIGSEQGEELGVIRTEELLAAGEHYGVHQFFTRAPDFGFSKSAQQTMKVWDDVALEDMVRVIRTYRPQVVINGWGGVQWGHGQHQASGILTPQAIAAAADPTKFPGQISEGLTPWKVTLELRLARDNTSGAVQIPVNDNSPLWGKSYVEMGMEGHAQHRSQGTPSFYGNPFFRRPVFLIREDEKGEAGTFDAKLLAEPLTSLALRFPSLGASMAPALESADQHLAAAAKSALNLDRAAAAKELAEAGSAIAAVRLKISQQTDSESVMALWEVDQVREKIDGSLACDVALPIEAQADRHELVAGDTFSVEITVTGKPLAPVKWTLDQSSLALPPGWSATAVAGKEGNGTHKFNVAIPVGSKPSTSPADAILPFPPPLVRLSLRATLDDYGFQIEQAITSVSATTTGIKTYPLELVPTVTLTVEQPQVMVPVSRSRRPLQILTRVRYHGTSAASVSAGLDAPKAWSLSAIPPLEFSGPGDQLIRFVLTPPAQVSPGAYPLHPYARIGEDTFGTSLEPIPTLPTRDWSEPADATVHELDLAAPSKLHVGYIAAENDPLPEILRQLGIKVDLLDEVALAFGDLSQFDAVAVGIRAYELRPDLPRMNKRLLDYVQRGGTLLVQYQRDFAWNKAALAPYRAEMPGETSRVTDPDSPVRFLAPENPLLNSPNKISLSDFQGWTQERGLYFWGTMDSHYQPVLALKDPGEPEATGALVYARYGKGVYIYTGLSFFRQLPAGVPGAYRLFVNLLSQTQHAALHD